MATHRDQMVSMLQAKAPASAPDSLSLREGRVGKAEDRYPHTTLTPTLSRRAGGSDRPSVSRAGCH